MDFERALTKVGPLGQYHWWYLTVLAAETVVLAPHVTGLAFIGKEPDFSCKGRPKSVEDVCKLDPPCEKYEYSTEFTSIVSEWNLVCGESYEEGLAQAFVMLGFLIGNVILGDLSDKFGRLKILTWCSVMVVILQFSMLLCNGYLLFLCSRLLIGICSGGLALANYVIILENVMQGHRAVAGCIVSLSFAFGVMVCALLAFFIRDWRLLSVAIAVLNVPYMFLPWIIPESPRWLVSKGRLAEAEDILFTVAKGNGREISRAALSIRGGDVTKKDDQKSMMDSLRTPVLRHRMLILTFCWFTCSFVYYGLTMNASSQGSNMYLSFAFSGLVEFPAHITCIFVLDRYCRMDIQNLLAMFSCSHSTNAGGGLESNKLTN